MPGHGALVAELFDQQARAERALVRVSWVVKLGADDDRVVSASSIFSVSARCVRRCETKCARSLGCHKA